MPEEEIETNHHSHETIIKVQNVSKDFIVGKHTVNALTNINLEVKATDFIVIFGPSGCGKSTLFNAILGLDEPTKGEVSIRDTNIYKLSDDERAKFRIKKIGMVYQMSNWIRSLNVVENVAFPLITGGVKEKEAISRAHHILDEIGIDNLSKQVPTQLSGGEQQKAGIARALVSNPWILLADEPTGNLDTTSGDEILNIFNQLNIKSKRTIMMVTHNGAYWDCGNRRLGMRNGEIIQDTSKLSLVKKNG